MENVQLNVEAKITVRIQIVSEFNSTTCMSKLPKTC